jgi:hypothetical protein
MADIAMCKGKDCPLKYRCYRVFAVPNEHRQCYFINSPYNEEAGTCPYFWDMREGPEGDVCE